MVAERRQHEMDCFQAIVDNPAAIDHYIPSGMKAKPPGNRSGESAESVRTNDPVKDDVRESPFPLVSLCPLTN